MGNWNKAAVSKHVWFLFTGGAQSLWCQRVKSYLLKGRSFWSVSIPQESLCVWRKLLRLREWVWPLIKHVIANGTSTFLRYDNWHPMGPIIQRRGERIVYAAATKRNAKVSTIIRGNEWKWPRTSELIEPRRNSNMLPDQSRVDEVRWVLDGSGKFAIQSTWEHVRDRKPVVRWWHLLWFPNHIPRFSFVVWTAIRGRLSTGDRLVGFGVTNDSTCFVSEYGG